MSHFSRLQLNETVQYAGSTGVSGDVGLVGLRYRINLLVLDKAANGLLGT